MPCLKMPGGPLPGPRLIRCICPCPFVCLALPFLQAPLVLQTFSLRALYLGEHALSIRCTAAGGDQGGHSLPKGWSWFDSTAMPSPDVQPPRGAGARLPRGSWALVDDANVWGNSSMARNRQCFVVRGHLYNGAGKSPKGNDTTFVLPNNPSERLATLRPDCRAGLLTASGASRHVAPGLCFECAGHRKRARGQDFRAPGSPKVRLGELLDESLLPVPYGAQNHSCSQECTHELRNAHTQIMTAAAL